MPKNTYGLDRFCLDLYHLGLRIVVKNDHIYRTFPDFTLSCSNYNQCANIHFSKKNDKNSNSSIIILE